MAKRIARNECLGVIIDVQEFFLGQVDEGLRPKIEANLKSLVRLLGYFKIPIVVTLERSVADKGSLPAEIDKDLDALLGGLAHRFEKDFFDLTKENKIRDHLKKLHKSQAIVAGCETDVCVLQSCLGLIDLGYEVFVVEELLFSSAQNVAAAVARLKAEGVIFVTYKTLFYELIEAVDGGRHGEKIFAKFGPFPDGLPDCAEA